MHVQLVIWSQYQSLAKFSVEKSSLEAYLFIYLQDLPGIRITTIQQNLPRLNKCYTQWLE